MTESYHPPIYAIVLGLAVALGLTVLIAHYQVGPRFFWAHDVCPDPEKVCGVVPVGMIVSAATGAFVATVAVAINRGASA